jgi:hypothetical protein
MQKLCNINETRQGKSKREANAWQRHSEKDSLFNVPLTDKAGRQYTLSQKYGIK